MGALNHPVAEESTRLEPQGGRRKYHRAFARLRPPVVCRDSAPIREAPENARNAGLAANEGFRVFRRAAAFRKAFVESAE